MLPDLFMTENHVPLGYLLWQLLRFPNHAVQLTDISLVITIHLFLKMESHGLIYLHVWHVPARFQVALLSFLIRQLRDLASQ